ncbi:hypothetical protein DESC_200027 [Desulfosarcina cetonica]|nr:hypothetical protein DESC_200027 [Desulfosarcina cetonica]
MRLFTSPSLLKRALRPQPAVRALLFFSHPVDHRRLAFGQAVVAHLGIADHHGVVIGNVGRDTHLGLDRRAGRQGILQQAGPTGAHAELGSGQFQVGERQGQIHHAVTGSGRRHGHHQAGGGLKDRIEALVPGLDHRRHVGEHAFAGGGDNAPHPIDHLAGDGVQTRLVVDHQPTQHLGVAGRGRVTTDLDQPLQIRLVHRAGLEATHRAARPQELHGLVLCYSQGRIDGRAVGQGHLGMVHGAVGADGHAVTAAQAHGLGTAFEFRILAGLEINHPCRAVVGAQAVLFTFFLVYDQQCHHLLQ